KPPMGGVGEWLCGPMMGWIDDQGVLTLCDIGGQPERGWDPTRGHGAMYRLYPDSRMGRFLPYDKMGPGMPMSPRQAPAWFGDWEGTLFFPGQSKPGREGALS